MGCLSNILSSFFAQLAYCVVQFLEKDSTLTEPVGLNLEISHKNVNIVIRFTLSDVYIDAELFFVVVACLFLLSGCNGSSEILAKDPQPKGSDVPQ